MSILTYDEDGFVVDLELSNRTRSAETLAFLKAHRWLDERTRAVVIEINVYNGPLNLFCLGKLTVELTPINGMMKRARFVVTKLFALSGVLDSFSVTTHVFVFFFFLIFIYREAKQLYRYKVRYFFKFWSCLQFLIILVASACVGVFFIRLALVEQLVHSLKANERRFITFELVAFADLLLGHLIAFVVFISWIRVIKLLRFNRRLSFLQGTLRKGAKPLAAFSLVFLTLFVAYAHFGYLVFSRELDTFRDIPATFVTLCSLFMGHFDFHALEGTNCIIGPIFLFSAMFYGVFVIVNLFVSVILEAFLLVKSSAINQENKYELLDFVAKQLRAWLGITETRSLANKCRGGKSSAREMDERRLHIPNSCCRYFLSENELMETSDERTRQRNTYLESRIPETEDSIFGRAKRRVSLFESLFESLVLDDRAEEVFLHKLFVRGLGLSRFDWLAKVNREEFVEFSKELCGASKKYSPGSRKDGELLDQDNKDEMYLSQSESYSMVSFELRIEVREFKYFSGIKFYQHVDGNQD